MLSLLLFAAAAPHVALDSSAEVRAAIAGRATAGDAAFIATIQELVDRDDPSAIELMGELHAFGGIGVTRDPAEACALFSRAAERRGDSAHNLARCYETGEGLAADAAKARHWYAKGAAFGYAKSDCALGNLMVAGSGGPRDVAGGILLCRKAAEAGDRDAQTDLGNFLLSGVGGKQDIVEARKWYKLAAKQNQANAQFVLGQIYWKGDGTPVDRAAAAKWWKLAYAGGRKDAAGLIVSELSGRIVIERNGQKSIDRSLLPELQTWLERAAVEDPDPARRRKFADWLAELKGG